MACRYLACPFTGEGRSLSRSKAERRTGAAPGPGVAAHPDKAPFKRSFSFGLDAEAQIRNGTEPEPVEGGHSGVQALGR